MCPSFVSYKVAQICLIFSYRFSWLSETCIISKRLIDCIQFCRSIADTLRWDELIFTQEWGYSACRQFKDHLSDQGSEKKCRFEGQPSIWSVHGIW